MTYNQNIMTSSNGKNFCITGPLCGEFTMNSPHKGQWRWALMFSLIWAWMNSWVNNREAGDLKCHYAHYDIVVMKIQKVLQELKNWYNLCKISRVHGCRRNDYRSYSKTIIIIVWPNLTGEAPMNDCTNHMSGLWTIVVYTMITSMSRGWQMDRRMDSMDYSNIFSPRGQGQKSICNWHINNFYINRTQTLSL